MEPRHPPLSCPRRVQHLPILFISHLTNSPNPLSTPSDLDPPPPLRPTPSAPSNWKMVSCQMSVSLSFCICLSLPNALHKSKSKSNTSNSPTMPERSRTNSRPPLRPPMMATPPPMYSRSFSREDLPHMSPDSYSTSINPSMPSMVHNPNNNPYNYSPSSRTTRTRRSNPPPVTAAKRRKTMMTTVGTVGNPRPLHHVEMHRTPLHNGYVVITQVPDGR